MQNLHFGTHKESCVRIQPGAFAPILSAAAFSLWRELKWLWPGLYHLQSLKHFLSSSQKKAASLCTPSTKLPSALVCSSVKWGWKQHLPHRVVLKFVMTMHRQTTCAEHLSWCWHTMNTWALSWSKSFPEFVYPGELLSILACKCSLFLLGSLSWDVIRLELSVVRPIYLPVSSLERPILTKPTLTEHILCVRHCAESLHTSSHLIFTII